LHRFRVYPHRRAGAGNISGVSQKPVGGWEQATWSGARQAGLQAGARLTLAEKLAWLEQAHRLVEHLEPQRALRMGKRSAAGPKPASR
ncbi:MAG TPA: hypothetical protein VJU18_17060, partial [Vicinamibacteria bacterium]|nr:hypothetical protein [Vicinamibacteria bacterium]